MIRNTLLLLVAPLLGASLADQLSEEYTKDESTFIGGQAPQFRDSSEFLTSQPDPFYVPIKGLPAHQHGFELINPEVNQQGRKQLSESQRETIRKQEDFLKSVLDSTDSGRAQGVRPPNVHLEQQQDFRPSQPLSASIQSGLDYTGAPENTFRTADFSTGVGGSNFNALQTAGPVDFEPHKTFNFRVSPEQANAHQNENAFPTAPSFSGRNSDFTSIQKVNHQRTMKRPSFVFRNPSAAAPSQQRQESVFGEVATSERMPTPIFPSRHRVFGDNSQRQGSFLEGDQPHQRFNVNRGSFTFKSTQEDQKRLTQQVIEQPITRRPVFSGQLTTTPSAKFGIQEQNDEEEMRFISRVNENTAAGAALVDNLKSGSFQAVHPPLRTDSSRPAQEIEPTRRWKIVGLRRKPAVIDSSGATSLSSTRLSGGSGETLNNETEADLEARKQAENAKYEFSSSITDSVNDNTQLRQEVRDGLKLSGMYSYSDGYYKRTVYYEADENGYRIVKEESEPIGTGPLYNPNGEVQVNYSHSGSNLKYRIRGDQLKMRKPNRRPTDSSASPAIDYVDQLELPVQK